MLKKSNPTQNISGTRDEFSHFTKRLQRTNRPSSFYSGDITSSRNFPHRLNQNFSREEVHLNTPKVGTGTTQHTDPVNPSGIHVHLRANKRLRLLVIASWGPRVLIAVSLSPFLIFRIRGCAPSRPDSLACGLAGGGASTALFRAARSLAPPAWLAPLAPLAATAPANNNVTSHFGVNNAVCFCLVTSSHCLV